MPPVPTMRILLLLTVIILLQSMYVDTRERKSVLGCLIALVNWRPRSGGARSGLPVLRRRLPGDALGTVSDSTKAYCPLYTVSEDSPL